MEQRKIFICACNNLEHLISFWYDEEDNLLYIEIHLVTYKTFFKRLWFGLKYAFGYKSIFGAYDEIILHIDDQKKLFEILKKKLKR